MATKEKTLSDAFYETLKDIYYAEKQSVRALGNLPRPPSRASSSRPSSTIARKVGQVERLEQVSRSSASRRAPRPARR